VLSRKLGAGGVEFVTGLLEVAAPIVGWPESLILISVEP
jgi:hypothetical protein